MTRTLTVGLTGGVASGKSLVQQAFVDLGVPVLDADQVARDVVAPGTPALAAIAEAFGPTALLGDGQLDRRRLREWVFADPGARRRLEAITHPAIRAAMRRWREARTEPYCILSVAILLEGGMRELVDRVLVVDVAEAEQLRRLMLRDGGRRETAEGILAAQTSRSARLAAADDVIDNSGSPEQARAAVSVLHAHYLALAAGRVAPAPGLCLPHP
jgi:dephospho-CoA kinase